MLASQQNKTNDQTILEDPHRHNRNRSPSTESLHQQSGGFAQSQPRRSSFSKENGYYAQNNGYRRQNYNNQRGRSNQRNYQNQQMSDYQQNLGGYGQGYQQKTQQNRSFQNYNQNYQKAGYYYQNAFPAAQNRPIFNSPSELGAYSVRRHSPSSSPSPSVIAPVLLQPNLARRVESYEEPEKMHTYRAAGTAPSRSTSSNSSPYKHPPPQPPSTPSSDQRVDMSEEWHNRYNHQMHVLQNQHRRGQHDIPAPINLQHKTPVPSIPMEIPVSSVPTTPSAMERAQFRMSLKDAPMARSVDSVDATHSCFADERMQNALYGMPLSTGSIDSGFFGCCATDDSLKKDDSDAKTASMTDEDEETSSGFSAPAGLDVVVSAPPSPGAGNVFLTDSGFPARKHRTRVRRSNRKLKRFPRFVDAFSTSPTTSGSSSCCLSVAGSSRSSVSSSTSPSTSIDELAVRLYFYFKSLLIAVNRQKTICESIAILVKDFDARWGNSGVRRKACDPKGCLAPVYTSQRDNSASLVQPARFPMCWAVPQPAIFYQLMASDVLEYIKFLERVSPQVKTHLQPPGPPILNERDASSTIETLQKLQLQHQNLPIQHVVHAVPFFPAFTPQIVMGVPRQMMDTHSSGRSAKDGKFTLPRDSSVGSRASSRADTEMTSTILSQIDDEVTGADLDKTPVDQTDGRAKSVEKKKNGSDLSRQSARRDSDCSSLSSSSVALDEATLTKILPTEEFHAGRGVASPSPPVEILSEPLSRMDVLSEKIWDYHNKVSQTDEMLQRKLHLRDMLYMAISPVFPMSGLYVVGSSLNGFGNNSSDMDLCLMITNKDLDQKNDAVVVLNLILSTLQYEKFVSSQKLILAKVPILRIKFAAPFDDITVDLNANNSVAIRNTHLLCYYSSYDWRVRPLVSVVKEWAKRKGINDANKSSFTSYSLVLMVIHYLQCGTTPRVLPNLQQTYPSRFSNKVDVRTLNVTMPLESVVGDPPEDTSASLKTTLGELLIGFLDYYANKFDYDRDAISIRQGQRVERATLAARPKMHGGDKETPPPSSSGSSSSLHNGVAMHHSLSNPHFWRSQWRCVCIEEPFTNSNTAHSIYDEMVFGAIKEAFREAHAELQHNHDLDRLMECEPIKASTTNAGAAVYAATYEGERPVAAQPSTMATANMRVINAIPGNGVGHFHYQQTAAQQTAPPQVLKQQRPGNYQPMNRMTNGNGPNGRRVYNNNQQQQQQPNGVPRVSKSNENFKEAQNQRPRAVNGSGAKENVATPTFSLMSPTDKKPNQNQQRKDEGYKTKPRALQSTDVLKQKTEKPTTPIA